MTTAVQAATRRVSPVFVVSIAACFSLLIVVYLLMCRAAFVGLNMHDYGREYYGLRRWFNGGSPYSNVTEWINLVPPFIHLLYLPFAVLPPLVSYIGWQALNLAMVVWVWWAVAGEHDATRPVQRRALGALFLLASGPVTTGAYTGQPIGWIALLGWGAWTAARQEQWIRVGVLLAILTIWKPTFGVLGLVLLLTGKWVAVTAAVVTALSASGIGGLLFGFESYRPWLDGIRVMRVYPSRMNLSAYGVASRAFEGGMNLAPALYHPALVAPTALLAAAFVAWRMWPNIRDRRDDSDWLFALGLVAASLLFPIAWSYYLPAAIGPLCAVFSRDARLWRHVNVFLACWMVPFSLLWLFQPSALASLTIGSIYFWGTFGLMCQMTEAPTPPRPPRG